MDGEKIRCHPGAALLLVTVLGTAGLTACTGDGPLPHPSSTVSASISGSIPPKASPTATPPTAPKAEPTPKSAEAFVKYFWEVYNYSYATLDSRPLREISKSTCRFCSGSISEIERSREKGITNEGGRLIPLVIAAPPGKIKGWVVVSSVLRQEASRALGPDHEILSTSKPLKAIEAKTRLEWSAGEWTTAGINIAQVKD